MRTLFFPPHFAPLFMTVFLQQCPPSIHQRLAAQWDPMQTFSSQDLKFSVLFLFGEVIGACYIIEQPTAIFQAGFTFHEISLPAYSLIWSQRTSLLLRNLPVDVMF